MISLISITASTKNKSRSLVKKSHLLEVNNSKD